ncbi:hypothetical protein EZV62_005999 [Acer yangbiense]|uniref:Uncharacterized protein n=1 Tax=Acer yangbiense TaxID=1000413 RepID=A0A5C7IQI8_9ROSI|nr:hypothetical protein EZV62_005999 [Acer yangbiense]
MQVGGVGLIFVQSGDNRLDPCVLIPYNKIGHIFFPTSKKQVLYLQSSGFPRVLKGNGYIQTIHKLLPFTSTGPSSMSQAVLKTDIVAPGVDILAALLDMHCYQELLQLVPLLQEYIAALINLLIKTGLLMA